MKGAIVKTPARCQLHDMTLAQGLDQLTGYFAKKVLTQALCEEKKSEHVALRGGAETAIGIGARHLEPN